MHRFLMQWVISRRLKGRIAISHHFGMHSQPATNGERRVQGERERNLTRPPPVARRGRSADSCAIPIKCDIAGVDFERLAAVCAHQQRAVR